MADDYEGQNTTNFKIKRVSLSGPVARHPHQIHYYLRIIVHFSN